MGSMIINPSIEKKIVTQLKQSGVKFFEEKFKSENEDLEEKEYNNTKKLFIGILLINSIFRRINIEKNESKEIRNFELFARD